MNITKEWAGYVHRPDENNINVISAAACIGFFNNFDVNGGISVQCTRGGVGDYVDLTPAQARHFSYLLADLADTVERGVDDLL